MCMSLEAIARSMRCTCAWPMLSRYSGLSAPPSRRPSPPTYPSPSSGHLHGWQQCQHCMGGDSISPGLLRGLCNSDERGSQDPHSQRSDVACYRPFAMTILRRVASFAEHSSVAHPAHLRTCGSSCWPRHRRMSRPPSHRPHLKTLQAHPLRSKADVYCACLRCKDRRSEQQHCLDWTVSGRHAVKSACSACSCISPAAAGQRWAAGGST